VAVAVALVTALAALLAVVSCHAVHRTATAALGLEFPALSVRIGGALVGTAVACLVTALAFRLLDGPQPREKDKHSPAPPAGKTLPRWHKPEEERSNGNGALYSRGKEQLPWT
jgi:hypothetical protein